LPAVDHDVRAGLMGRLLPVVDDVRRNHAGRADGLRELDVQEPRDATPDDDDRRPRAESRESLSSNDARERLHEHGFVIRETRWQREHPVLHVDRWHPDELRESARIKVRGPQCLAYGLVAREAIAARATGHVVGHEHAASDLYLVHAGPDL